MSEAREKEAEKRKLNVDDTKNNVVSGTQKKARENDAASEEEEVEEFFAILRRIHVAIEHFKKRDGSDGRKLTEESSGFRIIRSKLETEKDNGVKDGGAKWQEERMEENLGIDLNSEPGPDI